MKWIHYCQPKHLLIEEDPDTVEEVQRIPFMVVRTDNIKRCAQEDACNSVLFTE